MASSSLVLRPCAVSMEVREFVENASCASPTASSRCVAPWLMLPPDFGEETTVFNFYRLIEGDAIQVQADQQEDLPSLDSICLGSLSKGWLVCIQPKDCYLFMFNPLSAKTLPLPSIETFPSVMGIIRNAHSGLVESVLNHDSDPITPQLMSSYIVEKMILSSPDPMDEDCIAMVIYGPLQRLAFCRRPAEANSWTALDAPFIQYSQLVYHSGKKLFFALTEDRVLEAWDLHNDPVKRFLIHNEFFGSEYWVMPTNVDDAGLECRTYYCWDFQYFVYDHQSHELFIVTRYVAHGTTEDGTLLSQVDNAGDRYPYKTQTFDVFKVNFIDHDDIELNYLEGDLGNRAFFIGSNPGFALSTTMFPELKPNSIYFTDDQTDSHADRPHFGGHDLGIYDYKERNFLPCYYPVDVQKIRKILPAPIWFTPDIDATCLASTLKSLSLF